MDIVIIGWYDAIITAMIAEHNFSLRKKVGDVCLNQFQNFFQKNIVTDKKIHSWFDLLLFYLEHKHVL